MKIITLIGADASGKDTQIALLKEHFENLNQKVQVISIWDSFIDFANLTDKKSLQEIVETFLLKYEAHARSFFLMACLKNSLSRLNSANDIVLLNGFFHKYWASEMTYGVDNSLWEKNISEFIESDQVYYLKTSAEQCIARKTSWSKYEQGLARFAPNLEKMTKEIFQENLHTNLDKIAVKIPNLKIIDGGRPVDLVFRDLIKEI